MVLPRPTGKVLVMTKAFYPKGAWRLPSGGIHKKESPDEALDREMLEETGFAISVDRFLGKLDHILRCGDRRISFASHIYLMSATDEEPRCSDLDEQITGFREVSIVELHCIAHHLRNLPDRWGDWGRFRAIAHDFVVDMLSSTL
jgi:8-oxo-dGTP pyrophosphatase MutT (NUDIX family)